jgi:hypothetical protein
MSHHWAVVLVNMDWNGLARSIWTTPELPLEMGKADTHNPLDRGESVFLDGFLCILSDHYYLFLVWIYLDTKMSLNTSTLAIGNSS